MRLILCLCVLIFAGGSNPRRAKENSEPTATQVSIRVSSSLGALPLQRKLSLVQGVWQLNRPIPLARSLGTPIDINLGALSMGTAQSIVPAVHNSPAPFDISLQSREPLVIRLRNLSLEPGAKLEARVSLLDQDNPQNQIRIKLGFIQLPQRVPLQLVDRRTILHRYPEWPRNGVVQTRQGPLALLAGLIMDAMPDHPLRITLPLQMDRGQVFRRFARHRNVIKTFDFGRKQGDACLAESTRLLTQDKIDAQLFLLPLAGLLDTEIDLRLRAPHKGVLDSPHLFGIFAGGAVPEVMTKPPRQSETIRYESCTSRCEYRVPMNVATKYWHSIPMVSQKGEDDLSMSFQGVLSGIQIQTAGGEASFSFDEPLSGEFFPW